jgi:putative peptidoglycan lipid II flippase
VTIASRVVGFGRVAVLSHAVGTSCVGDTYQAANSVPNVVFEVVAGGALASLVVPVLAGAVAAGDRDTASRTASALLTWTLTVLAPVALLGMLLAPVLMHALVGTHPQCGGPMRDVGARMLVVFMPQVLLYGVEGPGLLYYGGRYLYY